MPFNGTGTYSPPVADFPAVTLTTISSPHFNNVMNDVSTGLSNAITRDGQSPWTANIPAGSFKITGLAAGTLRTDSARPAEIQDGGYIWGGTAGGTGDALTFTLTPAITAYVAGQAFRFKSAAANTIATTVAINGLATKAVQINGVALVANDIVANNWYQILYDGAAFQLQQLGTPSQFTSAAALALAGSLFTTGDVKLSIKTVADTGWVLMNDTTIGNAASAATGRANADTVGLFTLLYNNTVNGDCAVSGGRGANAAADYAANKTIALPKALGRALASFGTGSGLTARTMGAIIGGETHTIAAANLPASGLSIPALSVSATGNYTGSSGAGGGAALSLVSGGLAADQPTSAGIVSVSGSTGGGTTGNMGSGTAITIMQPSLFLSVHIKL